MGRDEEKGYTLYPESRLGNVSEFSLIHRGVCVWGGGGGDSWDVVDFFF